MNDAKLLRLLQNDPNAGMEKLIEQYAGLVCAVVRCGLSGVQLLSTDIDECAADAFSEFYLALPSFDPSRASIKSYLCVIARHNAADLRRKREKQRNFLSLDADDAPPLACDVHLEQDLEEAQLRRAVFQAIDDLGQPDKAILMGKYYYGQSAKELAAQLGLTVSNVNTRTTRALKRLRELFGGIEP